MINLRDTPEPLSARSLALSALLGTHPPQLPVRALIALGELFGIADGAMRTALSRMARQGEVAIDDGRYRLAGRLLDRQRSQDAGRHPAIDRWSGDWHTIIADTGRRELAARRRFRRTMGDHRLAELRPDLWMRPANLPAPLRSADGSDGFMTVTGRLNAGDPVELARELWPLDDIAAQAVRLTEGLAEQDTSDDVDTIPSRFVTAAAVLRFLRSEPLLPPELVGHGWAVDELRTAYAAAEAELQTLLRAFFRQASRAAG